MTSIFTAFLLLTTSAAAQSVGGGSETVQHWQGYASGDRMGDSVSDAGDLNQDGFDDVLVGAPGADLVFRPDAGSAYAYSGMDGSMLFQWDGQESKGIFGSSVACAGDVNADGFPDVIVGAPGTLHNHPGWVQVFSGKTGLELYTWTGQANEDNFGYSVSGAGDVNQDGFDDLIVGAHRANSNGLSQAGSVYVYSGADGSLLYQWDGQTEEETLGMSVSKAGDVNHDGFADLIVGARPATAAGVPTGSAFVYSGATGSILYQFDGEGLLDYFGDSVSDAGDVNKDGTMDLIIGAHWADANGLSNAGSAYVYSGADGTLLHKWNGKSAEDWLGDDVSGAGDVNADGYDDLIVGASNTSPGGAMFAGSILIFSGKDGTLLHQFDSKGDFMHLGNSVSKAGDIDQDGNADFIVGIKAAGQSGMQFAGAAKVFSLRPYLRASASEISASSGGVLHLTIDFPEDAGLYRYKTLISASGIGPSHFGIDIPLAWDNLAMDTANGNYPFPTYTGLQGTLDSEGSAAGALILPPGSPSALVGQTFHLAVIAHPLNGLPEFSSVAVAVEITP